MTHTFRARSVLPGLDADRLLPIEREERQSKLVRYKNSAPFLTDAAAETNQALKAGENVILEGSQGFGISLYYGTFPYVTSKDTTASQIAADVGVGPTRIDETIVVFKTFPTRVGEGPFETQMSEGEAKKLRN